MIEQDFYPPATEKQIDHCLLELFDNGFKTPPPDYLDFLRKSNGWHFNGNSLFGTHSSDCNYSLYRANNVFSSAPNLQQRIVLGREDEGLFLYDHEKKTFLIVDRMDCMVYEEFHKFQDFLTYLSVQFNINPNP